jgi:chemotaxis protein MotB
MAASNNEKKQTIVIKKITVVAGGGHGGSWKVAFADFMTAMMAFFLVMWLVNQSPEVKKSVAEYFSTPSIIEYNFSNFGVELTLEKLFLDLLNEPLKAFEQFVMPADKKPNVMDMGLKKIQIHYMAEKIGEFAKNIQVLSDEITFDIPDEVLFKKESSDPANQFATVMEQVRQVLEGLKDVDVYVNSELPYRESSGAMRAKNLAEERLDFVMVKVEQSIVEENVDLFGKSTADKLPAEEMKRDARGYVKFRIRNKAKPKTKTAQGDTINSKRSASLNKTENGLRLQPREPASERAVEKSGSQQAIHDTYESFVEDLTRKAEGRPEK